MKTALNRLLFDSGVQIRAKALDLLADHLAANSIEIHSAEMEGILQRFMNISVVDVGDIHNLINTAGQMDIDKDTDIIVMNLLTDLPHYCLNPETKTVVEIYQASVLNPAEIKTEKYRERFEHARFRISYHPSMNHKYKDDPDYIPLIPISALIGRHGTLSVLGILNKRGKSWFIEDLFASAQVDISHTEYAEGFFVESLTVLAQGQFVDGVFMVRNLSQPPVIPRSSWVLNMDMFGARQFAKTISGEPNNQIFNCQWPERAMIVVLSNLHLNEPLALLRLEKLLEGYSSFPELTFILLGNFSSKAQTYPDEYIPIFTKLAEKISIHPKLRDEAVWVIVPGLNDPGLEIFPRNNLPHHLTQPLSSIRNLISTSNPTRISHCRKQLTVSRYDQLRTLLRNTALPLKFEEAKSAEEHLVHTIVSQGHLAPAASDIVWGKDHVLSVSPLPDFIILGESTTTFIETIEQCTIVNPGIFSRDGSFITIRPFSNAVQSCVIEI